VPALCPRAAVFPLRLIEKNPLPRGFLPKIPPGKAKGWVYPAEDATLLASPAVPLACRVFYGFLHREGPRHGEAVKFTYSDFDLANGTVTLDENKTDDPRAWALSPGMTAAIRAWRELRAREGAPVGPDDLVFVNERGLPISENHAADRYRDHLAAAGIDRPVLFEKSKARQPIRIHDTRATFITVSLANGKSETWVQDRTGHKSSIMINRYRRAARTAAELGLGELAPLDVAIPELAAHLHDAPAAPAPAAHRTAEPRAPRRIVSGIVSNPVDAAPEPSIESLMISASSPTRIRTGTPSQAKDFKGEQGDPNSGDPLDPAGSDDGSRRLEGGVADSGLPVADWNRSGAPSHPLTESSAAVRSLRQAQLAAATAGDFETVALLQELVRLFLTPGDDVGQ